MIFGGICGDNELDLWGVCLDAGGNACATGGNYCTG